MKSKTVYIVLGIAAVGGAVWYFKFRKGETVDPSMTIQDGPGTQTRGGNVLPLSPTKSIVATLPASLLEKTSGNTGIVAPMLSTSQPPVKIAQAPPVQAPAPLSPLPTRSVQEITSKSMSPAQRAVEIRKLQDYHMSLRGLGNAFILN
jgi:hypothetical protein